ncbi:MAG: thioredoxin family protein, partial [candidate division Zixibacteria bacterium]|nr:thioredoxin family protein [candidate division Zixibacteria bacterium]
MKHWPTATIAALLILAVIFTAIAGDDSKADAKTPSHKSTEIAWLSYDAGLVKAKTEDKHVFINFTTKWCGWCKRMNKTTFK